MAQQAGVATREELIEQFNEATHMEKQVMKAVSLILSRNPTAVLMMWEEEDGVKATTLPHSQVLLRGFTDMLMEMAFPDPVDMGDD